MRGYGNLSRCPGVPLISGEMLMSMRSNNASQRTEVLHAGMSAIRRGLGPDVFYRPINNPLGVAMGIANDTRISGPAVSTARVGPVCGWSGSRVEVWTLAAFARRHQDRERLQGREDGRPCLGQAYGMHDIALARGHTTRFGRHMIPGAPLQWLWDHRGEGFREPDRKLAADEILKENKWDALILQPFGRRPENSVEYGAKYAAAAYVGNPDCQVYVFANYPEIGKQQEKKDQWVGRWLSKTDTRGRATFQKVAEGISAQFPDRKPVKLIPVGEVMYQLHLRMQEGRVPGFRHIAELYADGVHLKAEGKYLEAVTHYAVVFQDDPHDCIISGLRFWKGPYRVERAYAEVVWDVVAEVTKSQRTDDLPSSR